VADVRLVSDGPRHHEWPSKRNHVGPSLIIFSSTICARVGQRQKITLNIGIMPSGHHDCKKVARQIKTGYCLKKSGKNGERSYSYCIEVIHPPPSQLWR
jgi:hypothetical protein